MAKMAVRDNKKIHRIQMMFQMTLMSILSTVDLDWFKIQSHQSIQVDTAKVELFQFFFFFFGSSFTILSMRVSNIRSNLMDFTVSAGLNIIMYD